MHDDLFESERYFDPSHDDAAEAEQLERLKAKDAMEAQVDVPAPPLDRRKLLLKMSQDASLSWSRRMDARRLLEVADLKSPQEFDREFRDFEAWNETPARP